MQFNAAHWLKQSVGWARDFDLDDDISHLYDGLTPVSRLTGTVRCMRIHSGILVTGICHTVLDVACSRCLEPIHYPVEFQVEETFRPLKDVESGKFVRPEDFEGQTDTMFDEALLIDDHYVLDLGEVVRQHLWIAVSQNPACAYAEPLECHNFQQSRQALAKANEDMSDSETGQAVAMDPRWAALRPLLEATDTSNARSEDRTLPPGSK